MVLLGAAVEGRCGSQTVQAYPLDCNTSTKIWTVSSPT